MKKVKENILLFLFFVGSITYAYADITSSTGLKNLSKFSLIPIALSYYIINSKFKNILYIAALSLAFTGDLLFSSNSRTENMIAIGCFILYNLLLTVIIFELFGVLELKKIIMVTLITIIFIYFSINFMLNNIGTDIIMILLYFFAFSILLAFSVFYQLKFKVRESLFFLIATLLFFIANLTKTIQYFESSDNLLKLINIVTYTTSFYFYFKAILIAEQMSKHIKN